MALSFKKKSQAAKPDPAAKPKKQRGVTVDPSKPMLQRLPDREWSQRMSTVPFISSLALRAYIEEKAGPLQKTIAMANGQPIPRLNKAGDVIGETVPTWDDQKYAINQLLPKVAPDLKLVEAQFSAKDPSNDGEDVFGQVVAALGRLALRRQAETADPVTIQHGEDEDRVAREG